MCFRRKRKEIASSREGVKRERDLEEAEAVLDRRLGVSHPPEDAAEDDGAADAGHCSRYRGRSVPRHLPSPQHFVT